MVLQMITHLLLHPLYLTISARRVKSEQMASPQMHPSLLGLPTYLGVPESQIQLNFSPTLSSISEESAILLLLLFSLPPSFPNLSLPPSIFCLFFSVTQGQALWQYLRHPWILWMQL